MTDAPLTDTPAGDRDRLVAVVDRYLERMSAGDKEGWLALFADDASVEDPVGTHPHRGRAAIADFWDLVQGLADEVRVVRTGPVRVAGGEAAFPLQARSTIGDTTMVVDIIDLFRFDDEGRIVDLRAYWDPTDLRPE